MSKKLEEEFKQLEEQVKLKMIAAAKLIDEAAELVAKSGQIIHKEDCGYALNRDWTPDSNEFVEILLLDYPFRNAAKPLMEALNNAGWSSSSMYCPS